MRTENRPEDGRLAPEDLAALRARLAPPGDAPGGASTVADLAESLGLPPERVLDELDRLREARALRPESGPRRQTALLLFAVFLFGAAVGIYRLTPRYQRPPTDAEIDAKSQEVQALFRERRLHPRSIHYPIETTVKTGALPPAGFPLEFRGRLTVTRVTADGPVMDRAGTERALALALAHGFEEAKKAELAAPEPKNPLPQNPGGWSTAPAPGILRYFLWNTSGDLKMEGRPRPEDNAGTGSPEEFAWVAKRVVDSAFASQDAGLKLQPVSETYVSPPPGYGVSIEGRTTIGSGVTPLMVLPMDEGRVEAKLRDAIRRGLRRDFEARPIGATERLRDPDFTVVTITGPLGKVVLRLPQKPSREYPTAVGVLRAQERLLAEGVRKAAAQVGTLNRRASG